jgi:hypothetical protein
MSLVPKDAQRLQIVVLINTSTSGIDRYQDRRTAKYYAGTGFPIECKKIEAAQVKQVDRLRSQDVICSSC